MTTKIKASRYNIARASTASAKPAPQPEAPKAPQPEAIAHSAAPETPAEGSTTDLDAIRQEGLTGRQLRMARRVAQKHGLAVTSDFDAVRQLRLKGIDPFQRSNILDLVTQRGGGGGSEPPAPPSPPAAAGPGGGAPQLPQLAQTKSPALAGKPLGLEERASEIRKMHKDIVRRRRRNIFLLCARLGFFIALPTFLAWFYFAHIATPMYATKSEFVIQQASGGGSGGSSGLAGLFQGTSMATQQDSISVQSYLASPAAMLRLDRDHGFRAAYAGDDVDALQRLEPDATNREVQRLYKKQIEISYDPTEGLVRMQVIAPTAEQAHEFNTALIGYAEEQVDQMTLRLRSDQMQGARDNYEKREAERVAALQELIRVQSEAEALDATAAGAALMGRITGAQGRRDQLDLELSSLLANPRPNAARVAGLRSSIARLDEQIDEFRKQISQSVDGRMSQTEASAKLREAEENYTVRVALLEEALAQMETARIEANRQVRYLSLSVPPVVPDAPSFPRVFENTALAFFVFGGLYMLMSLSAAVLKEQVSS